MNEVPMPRSRQLLCFAYAAIALLALVGTWSHNVAYFRAGESAAGGFFLATGRFWLDTLATPASTSITVDLVVLCLALFAWMVLEARRSGVRFVWLYIGLGVLIAISVTFPLYLIAREARLADRGEATEPLGFRAPDLAALLAIGAGAIALTVWTLMR
jgi:hypothetical protein